MKGIILSIKNFSRKTFISFKGEEIKSIKRDGSLTEDTKARLIKVLKDVWLAVESDLGNLVPGRFCCPEVSPNL